MDVYWLEQTAADVPAADHWLSAGEALRLGAMRFPKRRADWRLGRWTAKCAVAAYLDLPPASLTEIEIRSAPSGAPEVYLGNRPGSATISLSHRAGKAICAVAAPGAALGCDLEWIEAHSDAFLADYFTTEEQALVDRAPACHRPALLTLLWSGKESALKALHTGLRLDTRSVVVEDPGLASDGEGWRPLQVRQAPNQVFRGWWQHQGNFLETLVGTPPPGAPRVLSWPAKRVLFP
jgi:4'-phosphopantetheinyl transferase